MKLITRDTDYAMRALCFIAKDKGEVISVSSLVKALDVPKPFLRKCLQTLHIKGVLKSFKGQGGGFLLAKNPKSIFLTDIMRIFQGALCLNECFLRKLVCPHTKGCSLRKKISKIEKHVKKELSSVTVWSLINEG